MQQTHLNTDASVRPTTSSTWKHTSLKPGLRVEKSENAALASHVDGKSVYFTKQWRHHPTPRPLASDLWTLQSLITTTTTTTMADDCLCSCFLQLARLVVACEAQQQFDLIIGPHKSFWFPCASHFCLFLLVFINSAQTLCACSVSSSLFLVNFKHHL